ncbi:MAG: DnaB-like helicase C-terminal domain-containing protein [Ignavibacteria bacterium]|nr:DnaB-like helicase C-terminal domain-containing protein [Ignavibacteria bacterium]
MEENGVKVIILDYLQMMGLNKYRNSRDLEVGYITRELKNIARDNNVCVIISSQLSRAVETRGGDKRPQLSDLAESGAIEQNADKVIFLYRSEYYGFDRDRDNIPVAGVAELIIAKNRIGRSGVVKLMRDLNFTTFKNFDERTIEFEFSEIRLNEIEHPF